MRTSEKVSGQSRRTLTQAFLATQSMHVLLAEDNLDMRDMLEGALRREGYRVTSVGDGQSLLASLNARSSYRCIPELIISDVRMPGCSGLQVLEQLRRTDCTTPVILISAFSDADTHAQAERLSAVVLDKPFLLDDLRALTRRQRLGAPSTFGKLT